MTTKEKTAPADQQQDCYSDDLFFALLGGQCDKKETEAIRAHLKNCPACQARLMAIAAQQLTVARADSPSSSKKTLRYSFLFLVLAIFAIILGTIFF